MKPFFEFSRSDNSIDVIFFNSIKRIYSYMNNYYVRLFDTVLIYKKNDHKEWVNLSLKFDEWVGYTNDNS